MTREIVMGLEEVFQVSKKETELRLKLLTIINCLYFKQLCPQTLVFSFFLLIVFRRKSLRKKFLP